MTNIFHLSQKQYFSIVVHLQIVAGIQAEVIDLFLNPKSLILF